MQRGLDLDRLRDRIYFRRTHWLTSVQSLAYLEMYLCLATFFGRFDMALFETDKESMEWLDHGVASNRSQVKVKIGTQYH